MQEGVERRREGSAARARSAQANGLLSTILILHKFLAFFWLTLSAVVTAPLYYKSPRRTFNLRARLCTAPPSKLVVLRDEATNSNCAMSDRCGAAAVRAAAAASGVAAAARAAALHFDGFAAIGAAAAAGVAAATTASSVG